MRLPLSILGIISRNVRVFGHNYRLGKDVPVEVDETDNGLIVVDAIHHLTHGGHLYDYTNLAIAVAAAASLDVVINTPAGKSVHLLPQFRSESKATAYLYEAPTLSVQGTADTAPNRNRRAFAQAHESVITHTPTVTSPGTELDVAPLFAADGLGQAAGTPGSNSHVTEWVLAEGSEYMIRITNEAAAAWDLWMNLVFYEAEQ